MKHYQCIMNDIRIPVKEPHAAATAYSRIALRHRFPAAQVGDDLHVLFSEPGKAKRSRLSPDVFVALNVPRRDTRADYDADRLGAPDFVLEVPVAEHLEEGRGAQAGLLPTHRRARVPAVRPHPARTWRALARPCGVSR